MRDFATFGVISDARFHLGGKRKHWPETISRIWKTRPSHDFANFGNRWRCAISLGLKTEPLGGERFRLFGKCGRLAISLILEIVADARFHLAGNGAADREAIPLICKTYQVRGFANFGNRGRCAISLVWKTVPLAGKRFRLFGNAVDARCR